MRLVGNGTTGPYLVSGYFCISGSAQIIDPTGTVIDTAAYVLDADRGTVTFREPLSRADTVRVTFRRLAFVLPQSFGRRTATTATTAIGQTNAEAVAVTAYESVPAYEPVPSRLNLTPSTSAGSDIRWQGFKSFSLSTSNGKRADWSQGLELSVDGDIAEGVQMRAAISDRYSDAAATRGYGSATRLGDLDRFYLEAESQRFYGRFGQLALSTPMSGSTARQATGATFKWRGGEHAIGGYVGRVASRPERVRLNTQQNVAGPYALSDGGIGNIVPTSVVLTVDGRRLTEGAAKDYTFDASDASITFSPQSIPTIGSVVVAEYERSKDDYRRTLAGTSWDWTAENHAAANRFEWNWEADDPGAPLFGELTSAQRNILAGDADGRVAVPAYEYRGINDGDYDLTISTAGDTAFAYVGPGNGQWRVGFEFVGSGNGRYRHLAEAAYEYVGLGNGSYEPITTLGAPRSLMTVGETYRFDSTRLGSFEGTWFGVAQDPNRLASGTTTLTTSHHARWSAKGTTDRHTDNLQLDWWRTGASIESGRSADDIVRFANAWNLRAAMFDSSRSEYQVRASSDDGRSLYTRLESAMLQADALQAWRWDAAGGVRPLSTVRLQAGWSERRARADAYSRAGDERLWAYTSSARWERGPLNLTVRWREQHLRDSARVFDQQPVYLSERSVETQALRMRLTYRWRDSFDSLATHQRLRELEFATPLDWAQSLSGDLVVARGEEAVAASAFQPYYRGRLDASWHPAATATVHTEMNLAYTRTGGEREVYLPTRPGQGQYRLERGEYVPDAHGDYRRVVARSGDQSVSSYDGHQILSASWRPTIRHWRWTIESRRDRLGRHDPDQFKPFVWLAPWTAADWATVPGARAEQHDFHRVSVHPDEQTVAEVDYTADRTTFGIDAVRDRRDLAGLSLKRHLVTSLYIEGGLERERRRREGGASVRVDADAVTQRLTLGGRAHRRGDWSLEARRRVDQDRIANNAIRLLGLRPRVQGRVGSLNVLIETDATWVSADVPVHTLSAVLAEGRPEGFSLVEFCELRWQLPGQVSLRSRFHADVREHEKNRWRWEMSTVARF